MVLRSQKRWIVAMSVAVSLAEAVQGSSCVSCFHTDLHRGYVLVVKLSPDMIRPLCVVCGLALHQLSLHRPAQS